MQVSTNKVIFAFSFVVCAWLLFLMLSIAEAACKGNTSAGLESLGDSFGMLDTLFSGLAMVGAILAYLTQEESLKTARAALKESQEVASRTLVMARLKQRPVFSAQVDIDKSMFRRGKQGLYVAKLVNLTSDLQDVALSSPHGASSIPVFKNSLQKNTAIEIALISDAFGSQGFIKSTLHLRYVNAIGEHHECSFSISFPDCLPLGWSQVELEILDHKLLQSIDATRPSIAGKLSS